MIEIKERMRQDEEDCRKHFSLWMEAGLCRPWLSVLHLGKKIEVEKDATLLGNGNYVDGIYFIQSGIMRLISYDMHGNEAILLYVTENNVFGDSAYYNKMPVYAIFSAVENSTIYYFSRKVLKTNILVNHPEIQQNLLEYMAYKVGVLLHHQCEIFSDDIMGKVCRLIFDIAKYNNFSPIIETKISQQEMATALGLHRATLSKAISELKTKHILRWISKKEIAISDFDKLHKYANNVFAL